MNDRVEKLIDYARNPDCIGAVIQGVKLGNEIDKALSKDKVKIPILLRKGNVLKVDRAVQLLEQRKFLVQPDPILKQNIKYRNLVDGQVISFDLDQGSEISKDTLVYVKYITQDIIDASRKLYERQQDIKTNKKNIRKEKIKLIVNKPKNFIKSKRKPKDIEDL